MKLSEYLHKTNKTVLLRDRKRRTARDTPTSKSFQTVCPILCPKCLSNFVSKILSIFCPKRCPFFCPFFCWRGGTPPPVGGGTPGGDPPVGGVPPRAPPQLGGYPRGAPPVGGGTPGGTPPVRGGGGGYPRGAPPSWGGPPCGQTNWKHYLPVILRMRAVNIMNPSLYKKTKRVRPIWFRLSPIITIVIAVVISLIIVLRLFSNRLQS